ncbi:uncharacterized protein ACA1_275020 [Acanthamoeba castellanii str. Neff]|uniref:Uncharacterized protein n=1 Tax=Acanthamoeba castellanii (strain ATCC 30010 / Neff) TaxID=1257118 RepID=L8GGN5_ACACF|nr:uncharacterized protein ACA1_275020 [Acanthamoeba castellanii str. Neff]ELR11913.1 hypothetical protein ACA1_275020 [Acanthamoeba castellanii str. Neff]
MTFAQLACTVLGDTDQSSMAKLREAYQAQPYELKAIEEHLQYTLIQVELGLWQPYWVPKGAHLLSQTVFLPLYH